MAYKCFEFWHYKNHHASDDAKCWKYMWIKPHKLLLKQKKKSRCDPEMMECSVHWGCATYIRAIADRQGLQGPGESKPHQDVKHVTADGVGHRHVSHSWTATQRRCCKTAETQRTGKESYLGGMKGKVSGQQGDRKVGWVCGVRSRVGWDATGWDRGGLIQMRSVEQSVPPSPKNNVVAMKSSYKVNNGRPNCGGEGAPLSQPPHADRQNCLNIWWQEQE